MPGPDSIFVNVWKCFLSPKLYRIYNVRNSNGYYESNTLEKWGDTIIQASIVLWHVTCYAFPIMAYTAYKRNYFTSEGQIFLLKLGAVGAITVCTAFMLRALGRAMNATYLEFNEKYRSIIRNYNDNTKKELQNYEFDYGAWPVDFDLKDDKYKGKVTASCSEGTFSKALSSPSSLIGYATLHTFAIKMIYPGSISTINYLIRNNLSIGRKKLIEEKHAERFKLATPDSNELDVMFVDQRNKTYFE